MALADLSPLGDSEVVLVGGQIAAGKTSAASGVATRGGAELILVRQALEQILGGANWDRRRLQQEGADLDRRSNGKWLLDFIVAGSDRRNRVVVDAARTRRQVEPILEAGVGARLIFLVASETTRRARYALAQATDSVKRSTPFDAAMSHETEREAATLRAMADIVIETDDLAIAGVVDECCAALRW